MEPRTARETAIVLLAGGASSRLGRPKQLLAWKGTSLTRSLAMEALSIRPDRVVVVTGASAMAVEGSLAGLDVRIIRNSRWQEGMASSIGAGIASLSDGVKAAVLMLCDQPAVNAGHLSSLIAEWSASSATVVASRYAGVLGPPVLFARSHFDGLRALTGDAGARSLMTGPDVHVVDLPGGELDIDTPDDLRRLMG